MMQSLAPGQPIPWFRGQVLGGISSYALDSTAGRWVVLLLMGSGGFAESTAALRVVSENRQLFDDDQACFFGVTVDQADVARHRVAQQLPGIRWFLDFDRAISRQLGALGTENGTITYTPRWLLLDPMLRLRFAAGVCDGSTIMAMLREQLASPPISIPAPVLVLPDVLSPDLCRRMIAHYDREGGTESGFMREKDGRTVHQVDYSHKRRADCLIKDDQILRELRLGLSRSIRPMIRRAFQFDASRIERFIVACYDGDDGGHFRAHRDNTTKGTAHRKFACTINLNGDAYEGGDLSFPEFGPARYRAPTGGAVVFSCSLLHQVDPVTRGRRYAFLPFFYDDDGARTREANLAHVGPELQGYKSGL